MKQLTILQKIPETNTKKYEQLLDNFEQIICVVCGRETETYWDPHYNGIRASCKICEINWAES